jgi:hypothetical protein
LNNILLMQFIILNNFEWTFTNRIRVIHVFFLTIFIQLLYWFYSGFFSIRNCFLLFGWGAPFNRGLL